MNIGVILYGQVRTLEKTIYSIKKFFRDIMMFDIYVILNLNDDDDEKMMTELIFTNLEPKLLKIIYNNNFDEINVSIDTFEQKQFKASVVTFDDYTKLPYKENYFTIDELNKFDIKINEFNIDIKKIVEFPYNLYIEDKLVYNIFKDIPNDKYDKIFMIRTDCAWFENINDKFKYVYTKETGFREKTTLKNEYNDIVRDKNFDELKNMILQSENNVLGNYYCNINLNLKIPNAHARLFNYKDLDKMFKLMTNYGELIKLFSTYPLLKYGWDGELYQKRIYDYLNFKFDDVYLCNYISLIREK